MNGVAAQKIVEFATAWVQQKRKYDYVGAMSAGARNPLVCVLVFGVTACLAAQAGEFKSTDKFYCSQLVLETYRLAGVPFVTQNPKTSQPQDIVTAYSQGKLLYVGHLIAGKEDQTIY